MNVRRRVLYRGSVQGVGFRATCHSLAGRYAVGGHVRNLADGGVELVVEGDLSEVEAVLEAVDQRMGDYIRGSTTEDEAPTGEREFRIAR